MTTRFIGLAAAALMVPSLAIGQTGAPAPAGAPPAGAQAPAAGRGAAPAPAPANYPPYTRPVSSYVPPRTPDGQPDITGLYLAIPLPRNVETPLVPIANRAANRANSEFSFSLNERPKLPEGAIARPATVDPADGRIPLRPEALQRRKDIMLHQ